MKLGRRPGTYTTFIDSSTDEIILKVESNELGAASFSYHLYDSSGGLAADSNGPTAFPGGKELRAGNKEVLLLVPIEADAFVQYRLYNSKGALITSSDGARTQIFPGLRIEGNKSLGRPPSAPP